MNTGRFLLNFAASYSGGGFKRLYEYARWFDRHGGACFIIHPRCERALSEFSRNRFLVMRQSRSDRLFNDCGYLSAVVNDVGVPDLYYSYGIPVYARAGRVNWFHLSNVLPLYRRDVPLPLIDRLKFGYLGRRIRRTLDNADVISAESSCSLALIDKRQAGKLFLSVNGSDDELDYLQDRRTQPASDVATVVGTDSYKALSDSYRVFEMLRNGNSNLKLTVIGGEKAIPRALRRSHSVVTTGILGRSEVIEHLRRSRYYISTTRIENSYNAASEGVFFAEESYISDIGPHRELLLNMSVERVAVPDVARPILHVKRDDLCGANLKRWHDVVSEMIGHVRVNS